MFCLSVWESWNQDVVQHQVPESSGPPPTIYQEKFHVSFSLIELLKNVLQFLSISAHNLIRSDMVFQYSAHTDSKSDPTHETVTFFLYNSIKTATHSFLNMSLLGNWPIDYKVKIVPALKCCSCLKWGSSKGQLHDWERPFPAPIGPRKL